jgi:GT2 family glycosyltransferase
MAYGCPAAMNTTETDFAMKLSIIIVNYNTRELLEQVLQSIRDNACARQYEVIVVDNHSTDGSVAMLHERFPAVGRIENDYNAGFSKANNQGAAIAAGEYLLFLNSDTVLQEHALDVLLSMLEDHHEVAMAGAKLLNEDGSLQRSCGIFPNLETEFYLRSFLSRLFPENNLFSKYKLAPERYQAQMPVDWLSGACLMIRKSIFDQVQGFDENFYMFYEDVDLCYRIRNLGYAIMYLPDALCMHRHGGSWLHVREIPVRNSCRSALYFFEKHYPVWQGWLLRLLLLLEVILAYLIFAPYLWSRKEKLSAIRARLRGYHGCLRHIITVRSPSDSPPCIF